MSDVVKLRTRAEIDEEAAAWIWRMESEPPRSADPEGFEAWLRQDPRHRRAVDELSKVWEALDGLTEAQRGTETLSPAAGVEPRTAVLRSSPPAVVRGSGGRTRCGCRRHPLAEQRQ